MTSWNDNEPRWWRGLDILLSVLLIPIGVYLVVFVLVPFVEMLRSNGVLP